MEEKLQTETKNEQKSSLDNILTDWTLKAKNGELSPVIGRSDEVRRVEEVLSRKSKNNPVLIGEPGVGKTAIAEGIAIKIASGNVPANLKDKKIINLDLASLTAGSGKRGEFEQRLVDVINYCKDSNGQVILFIDEIHNLLGQAGEILKPALARGEIKCMGATTLGEYRKYFEKDAALARRFQKVIVPEPTRDDTIAILHGLKDSYEKFHNVKILDEAIVSAVDMSTRYITDRFLPDKAIDLLDEASASLKIDKISQPVEAKKLIDEISLLSKQHKDLIDENTSSSLRHAEELNEKLIALKKQLNELTNNLDKDSINNQLIENKRKEIANAKKLYAVAEQKGDYEKLSNLQYEVIPALEKEYMEMQKTVSPQFTDVVDKECIAKVIAKKTGINPGKILAKEKEKILSLNNFLSERVMGQDDALLRVSNAIKRSKADIQDENRPLGSFLFLGPTGVGKTEVAKALAEQLFDNEAKILRYDMSEFANKESAQNLIGSPVGYIGSEDGGRLTNDIKNNPYSIVLFDEIEKAHPDVFNVFLQILDEGHLTDNKGETFNFKNSLIIMTSNLGAEYSDIEDKEEREKEYNKALRSVIKPEIINRIDEVIVFNKLTDEAMFKITDKFIGSFAKRLKKKNIELVVSDTAKKQITLEGMDANFGARPLRRYMQTHIETPIAELLLSQDEFDSATISIDYKGNDYAFSIVID